MLQEGVGVDGQPLRRLTRQVGAAGRGAPEHEADDRPRRDPRGHLPPVVVVAHARAGEGPGRVRGEQLEPIGSHPRLHAGVPAQRVHQRKTRARLLRADGEAGLPPAAAHADEVRRRRGQRVRPDGGQVLVAEGIADEEVVGGIAAPRERPEHGRDEAGLEVEPPLRPRAEADVEGLGVRCRQVVGPDLGQEGEPVVGAERPRHPEPRETQRVVLVVGVVEEGRVLGGDGERNLAAEGQPVRGRPRRLRPGAGGRQQRGREDQGADHDD